MKAGRASLAVLLFVAVAVHAPFIRDGYITDDFVHLGLIAQGLSVKAIVTAPDTFGYFRPAQQMTYWVEHRVLGPSAGVERRVVNLALHAGVVALGFWLAATILQSRRAAFIASLAFVLSPKANIIAVLWISARAEILMALFSILALLAWIRWVGRGSGSWLLASATCYVLAVLSKEPAMLLPLIAALLPLDRSEPRRRIVGVCTLAAVGAAAYLARGLTGAITPTAHALSNLANTAQVVRQNLQRYLLRAMQGPAAVLLASLLAHVKRDTQASTRDASGTVPSITALLGLAVVWFLVFMLPALPVIGRSEIRVYLAGFGICLLAGGLVLELERRFWVPGRTNIALVVCVVFLSGYQVSRAIATARDMRFSTRSWLPSASTRPCGAIVEWCG